MLIQTTALASERRSPPGRHAGATLIELLIGIAIVAIMITMGLPSFMVWIQNTQIRTAAEAVLNGMQMTRAEAVRRNEQITFALNGFDWAITDSTGATIESRTAQEGSDNVVLAATGTLPLTFNGLGRPIGGVAVLPGTNDVARISVSNPTGGECQASGGAMRCLEIHVTLSGQVRMCDPRLPSSDPQGC